MLLLSYTIDNLPCNGMLELKIMHLLNIKIKFKLILKLKVRMNAISFVLTRIYSCSELFNYLKYQIKWHNHQYIIN